MANMSAIKLPDGITYNLVDKTSGYIKSYTDEKLKVEVDDGNQLYPILTSSSTTASTKKYSNLLNFTTYGSAKCLAIGGTASDSTKKAGALRIFNDAGGSVTLQFDSTATYSRGIIIPNKAGSNVTLATLQDIPSVPTNVSAFTNDAGYLTSYTETDPTVPSWAKASTKPTYTASEVGAAASSHAHGNITSGGDITATAPTIANGDQIVINDSSASKITNGPTFDGSTTTKALTPKGTWETFLKSYTETDPVFSASAASGITSSDITNWNGKTSNTGTVTSVGLTNATNGGLTISGSPVTGSGSIIVGHSNVLTNAQTTQAVYPIKIDKNGHISAYGSAVTIPTVPSNIVNTITTTAGTHTAISSKTGSVSFNVPTKTSHLTNDSGFITASHTSTYSLPLAASGTRGGVQIGYSESGTNYAVKLSSEKMYVTVPWTDTKVTTTLATGDGAYYLTASSSNSGTTEGLYKHGNFYAYIHGSTVTNGDVELRMGNSTAVGTAGAKQGKIRLYTSGTGYIELETETVASSANRTIKFPNASGTVALTSDIPSVPTKVSAFTNDAGYITTDNDKKLQVAEVTSNIKYYPIVGSGTTAATREYDTTGFSYSATTGTTSTTGMASVRLGNSTASGTAGNKLGALDIYGSGSGYVSLRANVTATSENNFTIYLPNKDGTVALTSDIPTNVSTFTNDAGYTTNTGTVTSVGLTNATNGGLTISGSPVTGSGSITVGHSNVLTSAQTTQAVYPIKIDKNGHISAYGDAQTILTIGTTASTAAAGNHTHSYAASASAGGSATYAATTADTANALYPIGVTSAATTTLKRDTSITFTGGTISCSGLTVASVSHTITSSEYTTLDNALTALI